MSRVAPLLLILLAAGCGTPGPREERVLLTDAQERARRDVLALYYSEDRHGTQVSIVIPRTGVAEARAELGTREDSLGFRRTVIHQGFVERIQRKEVPVTSDQREALEARFSALPPGESEWTQEHPASPPRPRFPGCGPETETERVPVTIRMVHVSRTGEVKTVIVYRGNPKGTPPVARPGGEPVSALQESFMSLFGPK
jgi:hypothetical protein